MRQSAERANGNLSHETPRSQTGSLRVEGSDGEGTYNWTPRPTPISFLIQERWVFLERTQILSGIQFTTHFIELFVVETRRFVGSFVNTANLRHPNNDCTPVRALGSKNALAKSCEPKPKSVKWV